MNCSCYVRQGLVYLPTWAETVDGVNVAQEPVAVIPVGDTSAFRLALRDRFLRGNPKIPRPNFRTMIPFFVTHAGVKSWSAFERGMTTWSIEEIKGIYSVYFCYRNRDKLWVRDPDRKVTLPPGTSLDDACRRIVETIQAEAGIT